MADGAYGERPCRELPCGARGTAVPRTANCRAAYGELPCRVRRTAVLRAVLNVCELVRALRNHVVATSAVPEPVSVPIPRLTPTGPSPYAARPVATRLSALRRTRHGPSPHAYRPFAARGTAR